jgi:hypothetical protein
LSLEGFIEKWTHEDYPPETVVASDLDAVEARFGFVLPDDYRQAVLAHGLPRPTIALLNGILAADLEFPDVSDFFAPEEMVRLTDDWRGGGMPDHLVAFASDCGGSLFCFDASSGADRATVWFWDHDDGSLTSAADSFTTWIDRFCSVEPAGDDFEP